MFKKTILTAVAVVFSLGAFVTPAQASHCPKDVKLIKAAMSKIKDAKMMTMAEAAADAGLALHKAKKHGDSIKVLHAAMELNGIKH